jgi:hypothetical protein
LIEPRKSLPAWSKVLIALVVVSLGGVFASTISVFMYVRTIAKQASDPLAIKATAQAIAHFPEPLPAGYKYDLCINAAPFMQSVTVEHDNDGQLVSLFAAPNSASQDINALVSRAYDYGISPLFSSSNDTIGVQQKFQDVKSKGEETVGNEKMAYIVGELAESDQSQPGKQASGSKPDKQKKQGMVGCIWAKESRKMILIYALQTSDSPYNQQVTMDLLKTIKGF